MDDRTRHVSAVRNPFDDLGDLVGLDVRLAIAEYLYAETGSPTFRPPQLLKKMVRAGKVGKKSGEGFYKY